MPSQVQLPKSPKLEKSGTSICYFLCLSGPSCSDRSRGGLRLPGLAGRQHAGSPGLQGGLGGPLAVQPPGRPRRLAGGAWWGSGVAMVFDINLILWLEDGFKYGSGRLASQ